ncbi:alpha-D-ribose 1-methylphosphonate 5-triphosphate diphosphatase [Cognatishimia sp. F0-27]|uniref:alpha-D-ribose 1-methylphosphonate 5-triphosphate diphosphatase n=1 Tax=Cognatishimia sp. F0-27 TaxID=2816855 RepID=UPI001D0C07AC|nr:alpha-D-ribose 1-methylphosphonate 5-triphosphate diphosphatase [Cognatishimia sp. F0-27]MCC1490999.1 alpha-D-ribose 1-methylphosphonate 5-triphosphate diphosphatase [Cognatishimia sp. F0-27]
MSDLTLTGARVMGADGWLREPVHIRGESLGTEPAARVIDLSGFDILPGIVDPHGDGFERHMAPRRGALRERAAGMRACAAELAANGITTAVLAQFWSWEGGMRGPDFACEVFEAVRDAAPDLAVDLRLQLRLETHYTDRFEAALDAVARFDIGYVVLNDHLPHDRLAAGRTPKRLTGQALKSGRNPADHLALMMNLHARRDAVPAALEALCARLRARGVILGTHDDHTEAQRKAGRALGATVAEFPETAEAARAARDAGEPVVLGAPNVVRGASHAGNAAANDLIAAGLCTALASDYHYPAPARAAYRLAELGIAPLHAAWKLISDGPAALLGLADRGAVAPGLRADLVIIERDTPRILGTISAGRIAYLTHPLSARFIA